MFENENQNQNVHFVGSPQTVLLHILILPALTEIQLSMENAPKET